MLAAGPMLVIDEIPDTNPDQEGRARLHRAVREAVRAEARDVRRQHLGRGHPARARDSGRAEGRQAGHRGVPRGAARCARARARGRRLPGRVQHVRRQPQRHGRARPRARDRAATAGSACCPSDRAIRCARKRRSSAFCWRRVRGARFGGDKLLAPLPAASHGVPAGTPHRRRVVPAPGRRAAARRRGRAPGDRALVAASARNGRRRRGQCARRARRHGREPRVRRRERRADADGWLVALADMPWIAPATIAAIARAPARRRRHRRAHACG